jgi:hypothetical protein
VRSSHGASIVSMAAVAYLLEAEASRGRRHPYSPAARSALDTKNQRSQYVRLANSADAALRAGAGRQDSAEQIQIKHQGDNEHQAPPTSRSAEHNDDDGDPNSQQQPDHQ